MIKFRTLKSKLVVITSALLAIIFIGQSIADIMSVEKRLREGINHEAEAFSSLSTRSFVEVYERYYISGFHKFKEIVEDTFKLSRGISRIRLVDMEGRVRFDTKDLKREELNELETIKPSLLGKARKLEPSFIYKNEKKNIFEEIIYPFVDEWGRHEYSMIYSVSYEVVGQEVYESIIRTVLLTLLLVVLSVSIGNFLVIQMTKPLLELQEGAKIIGDGNLDYKLKIKTEDEIGKVAHEFNRMTKKLKESRREIEKAKKLLEEQVKERTKELQKRVDELERFHKLTVGREKRMMELKKEIEKFKKGPGNKK